jgi:glucose-6-phosphate 1-dehydrogenase
VIVRFRRPPPVYEASPPPNYLRFRISPVMCIGLGVRTRSRGERMDGSPVELRVCQHDEPDALGAYERLLTEAMQGDATDFAREDYVEEAWRIVDPALASGTPVYEYEPESWGPHEVDQKVSPVAGWQDPIV